jgi:hypothetical protein
MKKTALLATCLFAPAILALGMGCKSKKVVAPAPEPESRNVFLGNWEGKDKNGNTYSVRFTSNLQWESHIEEGGALRPHYKGTYVPEGSRARMIIAEEGNLRTMAWMVERGNVPTNITANLSGNVLKVGSILTDAELRRR